MKFKTTLFILLYISIQSNLKAQSDSIFFELDSEFTCIDVENFPNWYYLQTIDLDKNDNVYFIFNENNQAEQSFLQYIKKINISGQLDPSFGEQGKLIVSQSVGYFRHTFKIVENTLFYIKLNSNSCVIKKYDLSGSPLSFNDQDSISLNLPSNFHDFQELNIDVKDHSFYWTGYSYEYLINPVDTLLNYSVRKYDEMGIMDESFAQNGTLTFLTNGPTDFYYNRRFKVKTVFDFDHNSMHYYEIFFDDVMGTCKMNYKIIDLQEGEIVGEHNKNLNEFQIYSSYALKFFDIFPFRDKLLINASRVDPGPLEPKFNNQFLMLDSTLNILNSFNEGNILDISNDIQRLNITQVLKDRGGYWILGTRVLNNWPSNSPFGGEKLLYINNSGELIYNDKMIPLNNYNPTIEAIKDSRNRFVLRKSFGDRLICRYVTHSLKEAMTIEIPEEKTSAFNFYPNPASQTITISSPQKDVLNYKVFSINGQLMQLGQIAQGENIIEIPNLGSGIYFMRIETDPEIINHKIVVIK